MINFVLNRFGTYNFRPEYFKKLSKILKVPNLQVNALIDYQKEVRLLDEKNRMIGKMHCDMAKEKAQKLGKDIVMVNSKVEPAICRICDYSDELAQKFIREVMLKSIKDKKQRPFNLGHRTTFEDMKIKVIQAEQALKKQKQLTVRIECPLGDALQSKNILYTFRDLCVGFMTPIGDIHTKDFIPQLDYFPDKDEEEVEMIALEYTFDSLTDPEPKKIIPQEKLELSIDSEYTRIKNAKRFNSEEAVAEIKKLNPQIYSDDEEQQEDLIELVDQAMHKRQRKRSEIITTTEPDEEDFNEEMREADKEFFRRIQ